MRERRREELETLRMGGDGCSMSTTGIRGERGCVALALEKVERPLSRSHPVLPLLHTAKWYHYFHSTQRFTDVSRAIYSTLHNTRKHLLRRAKQTFGEDYNSEAGGIAVQRRDGHQAQKQMDRRFQTSRHSLQPPFHCIALHCTAP